MAQVCGSGDSSSQVRSVAVTWSAFLDPRGILNILRMVSSCSELKGTAAAAARETNLRGAGKPWPTSLVPSGRIALGNKLSLRQNL